MLEVGHLQVTTYELLTHLRCITPRLKVQRLEAGQWRYDGVVADIDHKDSRHTDAIDGLDPADRDWLFEHLVEYKDLLQYLHDH